MDKYEFKSPSQDEIDDIIRNAKQMRAEAFAGWMRSAWAWIRHPRSISVASDRVPSEMPL